MFTAHNRRDRASLPLNLALFVGAALLVNALIFSLEWNLATAPTTRPLLELPGWLVGAVWSGFLFPLLATARWRLGAGPSGASAKALRLARRWVTALFVLCASWPLYGLVPGSVTLGLLGGWAVAGFALLTAYRVGAVSRRAALFVAPVALWTLFSVVGLTDGWAGLEPKSFYDLLAFRLLGV